MPKYSIAQIKDAYIQKKDWEKQFPVSYFLFRPISFYLTCLIIQVTESAPIVAWLGFAIALLGCMSFLFIPYLTVWPGIILLMIFALLDAVDGNIARVTKSVTYYGKYLDGMIGILIDGSYCFWLGLGLYNSCGTREFPLFLYGIIIMAARIYSSIFEGNYEAFLIQKQKNEGSFQETLNQNIPSSTYRRHWWYLLFININAFNLQLMILALCAVFHIVNLFLFFFALYYLFRFLVIVVFYIYRAQKNLN